MQRFNPRSTSKTLSAVLQPGAATLALLLATAGATAAPLNLAETHPGDVTSHFTTVTYNASTGVFLATGFPDEFDVNSQNILFDGGNSFVLSMILNPANGALISGTVSISGNTDGAPSYGGLLLSGNITQFGFPVPGPSFGGGNIFEFVVNVTGGALLVPYYTSHTAGIILNIANGSSSPSFTGSFTTSFQNNGSQPGGLGGSSDTFPIINIPEPSTLVLLAVGLVPLAWRRGSRGKSPT